MLKGLGVARSNIAEIEIFLTEHFEQCVVLNKQYVGDHLPAGTLIGVSGRIKSNERAGLLKINSGKQ
ncbi:hypothetical protein LJK87_45465 [Paenibacillus sp. P25]|nr:hypothetical protein LJK87_45465 [Paenibacillus sp. P25]